LQPEQRLERISHSYDHFGLLKAPDVGALADAPLGGAAFSAVQGGSVPLQEAHDDDHADHRETGSGGLDDVLWAR
jgi:hypothetical protein